MFGLIPLVATIILASIVTGAIAYFGGDIFSSGGTTATANTYINEASQIRSASQVFRLKTFEWPSMTFITSDDPSETGAPAGAGSQSYLSGSMTHTYSIDSSSGKVTADSTGTDNGDLTASVCAKIEKAATGTEPDVSSLPSSEASGQLYGCYDDGTNINFYHN